METIEPLGPPELPGAEEHEEPKAVKPQLIGSTKSAVLPEPGEEDATDDEPDALNEHVEDPGDPDGIIAADEERKQQAEHPAPETPVRLKRLWPRVLLTIIIIAAAAYGAYWYGTRKANQDNPPAASQSSQKQPTKSAASTPAVTATPTKHYDSTNFTLGIDYPETWTVTDTPAKLTVVSPNLSFTSVNGTSAEGHVVVTIQNQQAAITGYPTGGAVAVLASAKLTYKQPTVVQRAQTYLSYLSYANASGLDALYITGDSGYTQGQEVPMSDVVKGNPLISANFEECTSADCSTGTPTMLTLLASKWSGTQTDTDLTALFESLQLD